VPEQIPMLPKEPTITPPATAPLEDVRRISTYDRVRISDGRTGEVVGFYRRHDESLLVKFASGEVGEFPLHDVELL
jgi:hypothetical protein